MNNATIHGWRFQHQPHFSIFGVLPGSLAVRLGKTDKSLHWTPLYIKGKSGFKPPVLVKLKGIILHGSSQRNHDMLMVWTRDSKTLRSLKLTIGADVIFKYRLQFFTDLNGHLETKAVNDSQSLSTREREMLQKMRDVTKRSHKQSVVSG